MLRGRHITKETRIALWRALIARPNLAVAQIGAELGVGDSTSEKEARRLRSLNITTSDEVEAFIRGEYGEVVKLTPAAAAAEIASRINPQPSESAPATPEHELRIVDLEDQLRKANAKIKELQRESIGEAAIREILGVFSEAPAQPPEWLQRVKAGNGGKAPEVPVTIWSDWHYGETISRAETGGFNEFDMEIGERRIRRLVDATLNLCANHGPGNYPGVVINLLGDFVSGALHPELAKTDEEEIIPSSLRCRDILVTALTRMADAFGKVYVPCAAGNHGRATPKPEFKRYVYKNFDWLIYQLLARHFAESGDDRVVIDVRPSNEVLYQVFNHRFLAMHGDMMGVKGGDGIIGAIGPIMRGEIKTQGQATSLGNDYDVLLIGHWHQPLWLPRAVVNNCLCGFNEYARLQLRARPTEPSQMLFFVHPSRGITARWEVKLGEPKPAAKEWVAWREPAA